MFLPGEGETCSEECSKELLWRQKLASMNSDYYPRKKSKTIRIAELDPIEDLDLLIEDIKAIPGLIVDRYLIPKEVYHLFAANPPPLGPEFPIATLEGDWGERPSGPEARVYGLLSIQALLRELRISAFAATRKIDRSMAKLAKLTLNDLI